MYYYYYYGLRNSQDDREISAIIVTDNYLCYKEPKSPYNFFLILILTNYLRLKLQTNGNIERRVALLCSGRTSTSCLRSHTDPFAFLRRCRDFQTENEHVMLFDFT